MTKSVDSMTDEDRENSLMGRTKSVMVPSIVLAVGIGLFFGAIGGGLVAYQKYGVLSGLMLGCVVTFFAGVLVIIYAFRKWPTLTLNDIDTPRTRRVSWLMMALIAFSAITALMFVSTGDGRTNTELFSNGPLSPNLALSAAALWLIGMPFFIIYSRRNADEFNMEHQKFGEAVGFQFFCVVAPVWWIGWRGGFLPQPDVMIILIAVLIVSVIANLIRRAL